VVTWVEANFDQTIHLATVSRHIDGLQLSFRLTNGHPMPKSMSGLGRAGHFAGV
jgi:hypothetical protein